MPICPLCNGRKYDFKEEGNSGYFVVCRKCHGTGVIDEQTNEEWFCQLSTEEKAKFMCDIYEMGKNGKEYFMRLDKCVEWLKQPHKPIS